MAEPRSEFKNTTGGYIGVQVEDHTGRMRGVPVSPEATVWLTEAEQIATANAPRKDENNPFTSGALELVTPAKEIANRRPIGDTEKPQVTEASEAPPAEEPPAAEGEGDAASSGGGEEAAPGASDEPDQPAAEDPPAKAPEDMSQAERDEHNAKEAAKRAMPVGGAKTPPPQSEGETGAAATPSGDPPEGKRTATEQVGTPEAAKKA